jgi:rsbT antagonist protein RsbS
MKRSNIPIHLHNHCAVSMIQFELTEELLYTFSEELMQVLFTSEARGVILDLSAVAMIDRYNMTALNKVLNKCRIMGVEAVVCGLRPAVVSALITSDIDVNELHAFHSLDDAMDYCNKMDG